jgi:molecular chaperone Hsp33
MKKIKIYGDTLKDQLIASRRDRLYSFIMAREAIRCTVVHGTRMVNEMRWNHQLGILETLVLGHAYLAAALMSANLKGGDRIGLQVECSGPIKGLSVEANAFGEVRGYLAQVPIPIEKPLESFDLTPFYGAGFLSVVKFPEDAKHPFTGKVMMEYGRLAKDLALYYLKSEQIPTAISLGVSFDKQGEVTGAGAMLLQAMPGAEDGVLVTLEEKMHALASMGEAVNQKGFPRDWMLESFGDYRPRLLDQRGVEFMCHCSRERIRMMIAMLKREDLDDLAANGPFPVEIRCHYCNSTFEFSQQDLLEIQKAAPDRRPRPDGSAA